MKRWIALVMAAALILTVLSGCGDKKTETGAPAQSGTQVQTQTQAPAPAAGDSRLTDILNKAGQTKEMSFDMVMSMSGSGTKLDTTSKMYMSDKKYRMEMEMMGIKMITIANAQGEIYLYNSADKTAMKMTTPPQSAETPSSWFKESAVMKVVGEEKRDGFDCLVVTGTQEGNTAKMWVRKDIGMPIHAEQTLPQGPVVVDYKNFQIGPQPASLFELPAGTKITTMDTTTKP